VFIFRDVKSGDLLDRHFLNSCAVLGLLPAFCVAGLNSIVVYLVKYNRPSEKSPFYTSLPLLNASHIMAHLDRPMIWHCAQQLSRRA